MGRMARCMAEFGLEKLVIAWCIAGGETEATDVTSAPSMAVYQGADAELSCFVFRVLLFNLLNKFCHC